MAKFAISIAFFLKVRWQLGYTVLQYPNSKDSRTEQPNGALAFGQLSLMAKLVCPALICTSLICTNLLAQKQLTIQVAAPPPVHPIESAHRLVRADGAANASGEQANTISGPVSGYVLDSATSVRPIAGFGPFSSIAGPIDLGENIAAMIPSPSQNYLVEIDSTGLASLWIDAQGDLGQIAFPADVTATSSVTPSPLGFSAAVVSESRAAVQVFSSLPSAPALASSWSFSELGGAPVSVAVSDDGSALLYTIRDGRRERLELLQKGGTPQFISAGEFGPIALAPFSLDAAVTDAFSNRVYLFHNSGGQYSSVLLGNETAGISRPVGLEFSRDGQQVVVASAGSGSINVFNVDGSGSTKTSCQCTPASLTRLLGNAVFQVTPFDGKAIWVFDGDLAPPAIVPSLTQRSSN